MDTSEKFMQAIKAQFDWIDVLVLNRSKYGIVKIRSAVLFAVMHASFVLVFCGHMFHPIASWVLAFVLQCAAFVFEILHVFLLEEYKDRMSNAMELENSLNPIMVAQLSLRCFQLMHYFLMGTWLIFFVALWELPYDYWQMRRGFFMVDPTTVWREISHYQNDSRIRCVFQGILMFVALGTLVWCIVSWD